MSGHTSAIGNKFVEYAMAKGHEVELLGSNLHGGWRLGDRLPRGVASDGFVHFAHDRTRSLDDMRRDIDLIFKDFVGHSVLISTISAHEKSKSRYGKSKFIAEDLFIKQEGAVLKCGLIIDDIENRFMTLLEKLSLRFPVIFLPFSGKSNLYFTNSTSLLREIEFTLLSHRSGVIRTFDILPYSMERLVKSFVYDKQRLFIPMPSLISRIGILFLGKLFPKSNLLDSLKSLVTEISLRELIELGSPNTDFAVCSSLTKKLFIETKANQVPN